MKIELKENYTLIQVNEESFENFFQEFEKEHVKLLKKNLIIDFSLLKFVVEKNISLFLSYADKHINNGTSFVLVCNDIDIEQFPESFNIVPTLVEAEDVIEMEEIQRDLGF